MDLAYWQQSCDPLGVNENTYEMGDFNDDNKIDGGDLALWQQNYAPLGYCPPGFFWRVAERTPNAFFGGSHCPRTADLVAPEQEATGSNPLGRTIHNASSQPELGWGLLLCTDDLLRQPKKFGVRGIGTGRARLLPVAGEQGGRFSFEVLREHRL